MLSTSSYTSAGKPTSTSSGMGRQSSSTEPEVPNEDKLKDFQMLLGNISKSLDELENVFKSASSPSNATAESLADIKSLFNMSVDVVLLDESRLSKLRKAANDLVDKSSIIGQDKCVLLNKFQNEIDRGVDRLSTAVLKEKARDELKNARGLLFEDLKTHKTAFQPCQDEMLEMVSKQKQLEKDLRDYEMLMIQKMPHYNKVYSQQKSRIDTDISGFRVKEQLLQQLSQEIDDLRKVPSIDWTGLVAAFYN